MDDQKMVQTNMLDSIYDYDYGEESRSLSPFSIDKYEICQNKEVSVDPPENVYEREFAPCLYTFDTDDQTEILSSETIENVPAEKSTSFVLNKSPLLLPTISIDEQKMEQTKVLSSGTLENIYEEKSSVLLPGVNKDEQKMKQTSTISTGKLKTDGEVEQGKEKGFTAFIWIIENFSMHKHTLKKDFESPRFLVEKEFQKMKLYLKLYPKNSMDEHFIACFFYKDTEDRSQSFPVSGTLSYLDIDETVKSITFNNKIPLKYDLNNCECHNFLRINEATSKQFLSDKLNTLIIHCKLWWNQFQKPVCVQHIARTQLKAEKYCFPWEFLVVRKKTQRVPPLMESKVSVPIISKHLASQFDLELKFIPSYSDGRIYITPRDIKDKPLYCNLKLKLKSGYSYLEHCEQGDHLFKPLIDNQTWIFPTFPLKNDLKRYYFCNITLFCELSLSDGTELSEIEETIRGYPINDNIKQLLEENKLEHLQLLNSANLLSKSCATNEAGLEKTLTTKSTMTDGLNPPDKKGSLRDDLLYMFKNEIFCDLTLLVIDNKFNVHKSVLAARSPIFNDIIKYDGMSGELIISDSEPETVSHLLNYLYTDQVNDLEFESLLKLHECAEKYQVIPLRDECLLKLKSSDSLANICELFLQDDSEENENLKNITVEFICNHVTDIFDSEEWENVLDSVPRIAGMVMKLVCIRLSQKHTSKKNGCRAFQKIT